MKLKSGLTYFVLLLTLLCNAQQVVVRDMKNVGNNPELQFPAKDIRASSPHYIENKNGAIYQGQDSVIRFQPDMATFRLLRQERPTHNSASDYFAFDKNGVYFKGKLIAADTTGFTIFNGPDWAYGLPIIWKTNGVVCVESKVYTDPDASAFALAFPLKHEYFKDKNSIFYFDYNTNRLIKIDGSDAKTATPCDIFVCDKDRVYFSGKVYTIKGEPLKPVNAVLKKTATAVYRYTDRIAEGIDPATIRPISNYFAKDKNHVYWYDKRLPLSPDKLESVKFWDGAYRAFYSTGMNVYDVQGNLHPEYDAKTFGILPNTEIVYDKNGIYMYGQKPGTDTYGFNKIPFRYESKTSNNDAFLSANGSYVIYGKQAYYNVYGTIHNLTDEEINLAKTGQLDLQLKRVAGAKYYNNYYKHDGKVYWYDKPIDVDAATFEAFGKFYKDKNHVYAYDQNGIAILKDVDVATARIWNGLLVDENYVYTHTHRLIKNDGLELLKVFDKYELIVCEGMRPSYKYYIFKNTDGYWLVRLTAIPEMRNIGSVPNEELKAILGISCQ